MVRHLPLRLVLAGLATTFVIGCDQSPKSPATASVLPSANRADAAASGPAVASTAGANGHTVSIMDACDPDSFNAVRGAGACTRKGRVRVDAVSARPAAHQAAGARRSARAPADGPAGAVRQPRRRGPARHTSSQLAASGAGTVP